MTVKEMEPVLFPPQATASALCFCPINDLLENLSPERVYPLFGVRAPCIGDLPRCVAGHSALSAHLFDKTAGFLSQ
jgi:hypothetical protein